MRAGWLGLALRRKFDGVRAAVPVCRTTLPAKST